MDIGALLVDTYVGHISVHENVSGCVDCTGTLFLYLARESEL